MTGRVLTAIIFATLCAVPSLASARPRVSVDARQNRQHARIATANRNGALSPTERRRLAAGQAAVRAEERYYRRTGGGLSRWERADLQRDLNRTSRQITRYSHNGR